MYKLFEDLQIQLLWYKYNYYELNESIITDYQYDKLESISKQLSELIDYDGTPIHNMVGFSRDSKYWDKVKERII